MRTLAACILLLLPSQLISGDASTINAVIAKVNGEIILQSEALGNTDLSERIDQLLLFQRADELGINVDREVSRYVARRIAECGLVDPDQFEIYLRKATYQSFEEYKKDVRNSLLTRKVIDQEVGRHITITHADIQAYYNTHTQEFIRKEKVLLREILVLNKVAGAEAKAKSLTLRARNGENFGDLARNNSDSTTRAQSGELGGFEPEEMDKQIAELVFRHDRGYVTDPIRIPAGFLILKVEGRFKSGQADLEEAEDEITEKLYTARLQPAIREYLTQLRRQAYLQIKPGYVDSKAVAGKDTAWNR